MARRKLSKSDYQALQRGAPVGVRYPPGGGRAELRVATAKKPKLRRRPKADEQGG